MTRLIDVGSGPPLLVIHGGPGFDHGYMRAPLDFLAEKRRLVFYDQVRAGERPDAPAVTLEALGGQLAGVIDDVFSGAPPSVIAHSWGVLVLAAALRQLSDRSRAPLAGLLINPVAIERADFDIARASFEQTIPPEVLGRAFELAARDATGTAVMRLLLPYYVADPAIAETLDMPISMPTYMSVMQSLGPFDYTDTLASFERMHLLVGTHDITPMPCIASLTAVVAETLTVPTGHFPLHEDVRRTRPMLQALFGAGSS